MESPSLLLELAASDDVESFKNAVESDGHPIDAAAPWYGRSIASKKMKLDDRTPLAIAALYGSTGVLHYILSHSSIESINIRLGSDGATALHCAASGGAPCSADVVKMLIDAGADVDAVDASGRRPGDVIPTTSRSLETVLKPSFPRTSSPKPGTPEKKEYPPDLTLPDIKNGIYGTDEFRMFTFKVKPCSRAYSHDWTECPFVHPGENARRRDPRKYVYSCVPCPEFRKGSCRNGDSCEYAHGVFECWLHPAQYRTRLCKDEIGCNRRVCFFAHKPEELRSVNPTAASVNGMVMPSPKSLQSSIGLDMAAALMMSSSSPMSPTSISSGLGTAPLWMNNQTPTALQLPSSRLKSTMSARDFDVDFDLLGLEGYQQKLLDDLSTAASPRSSWPAASSLASSRGSEHSNLFTSLEPSMRSQLASHLLSGYGNNLPSSPTVNSSTAAAFGLDHSMAKAIMNSRSAAFAKRSQSFIDRGAVARHPPPLATPMNFPLSDWGSPDGKLDWGVQGEELNKFRKSASFAFRGNNNQGSGMGGGFGSPAAAKPMAFDEPDLSWVQSLVRDGPGGAPPMPLQYQMNGAGGGDYLGSEMFSPWGEEQMVA